jgi:hypothetical protein
MEPLKARRTTSAWAAVCLLAAAAVLSACGGGAPPKVKADSPEAYAEASCAVLEKAVEKARAIDPSAFDLAHPGTAQRSFATVASVNSEIAEGLGNIEPPDEIASIHEEIVKSYIDAGTAFQDMEMALDQPPAEAAATVAAIQTRTAAPPDAFGRLPDAYLQAFQNNERCKSLWSPTPQ